MKKSLIFAGSVLSAAGAGFALMKKKNICPRCEIKKKMNLLKLNYVNDDKYDNGVCLTPPMGWSSWNTFQNKIDEEMILETADAMKKSGLADLGYKFINIDDCWHSSMRDENGRLQGDLTKFPHGIRYITDKVNKKGLKLGIYSSNGTYTCQDLPASLNKERIDAETFADWGIEYFKYDYCHNVPLPTAAPYIDSITIGGNGIKEENVYMAKDAILDGEAKLILEDDGKSYVKGICSGLGSATFCNINVDKKGEYVLTLVMRKYNSKDKYCIATVNDKEKYEILIPETNDYNREGRHQIYIELEKGTNKIKIANPVASEQDSAAILYERMGKELIRASKKYAKDHKCEEKPILYSICEWGKNRPWKWAASAGNIWRTTADIQPFWASVLGIYDFNARLDKYASPGSFNDPDMLEVGNGKLTYEENKSHFTLWAMMAAPLILGNDIRTFIDKNGKPDKDNKVLKIVSNKNVIAIDQDPMGIQCHRVKTGIVDVLVKPLADKQAAICFFNKGMVDINTSYRISDVINLMDVQLEKSSKYSCLDLWEEKTIKTDDVITAHVPSHGVAVFRIKSAD